MTASLSVGPTPSHPQTHRPDDTHDAPEDLAALAHAAATIGDFKLKSDPGFMLPEVREGCLREGLRQRRSRVVL